MRDRINAALKEAMKDKDQLRVATLRLILAAMKDREIAERDGERSVELPETEVLALLAKMIRQREESASTYEENGRLELAERERDEIGVIRDFMPKPLSEAEVGQAISAAIQATGASSIRDMGKVMAALKASHAGRIDFGAVGPRVKEALG